MHGKNFIALADLLSDTAKKTKKAELLKPQELTVESFFILANEVGIADIVHFQENNSIISDLNEFIRTTYKEAPDIDAK